MLVALVLLTGCQSTPVAHDRPAVKRPSDAPTAACPELPGVELPPGCAPYDPEWAMAQNDRHRERMGVDAEAQAAAADIVAAVTAALEALRASGDLTAESVGDALRAAGASDVQVRDEPGRVLFGAGAPAGGCVFGELDADRVRVELGGYILDGGCLPAA
jgi:hypothetical protein